jgi:hypothetical protein
MNEYRTPYGVYTWQTPERGQRTEMEHSDSDLRAAAKSAFEVPGKPIMEVKQNEPPLVIEGELLLYDPDCNDALVFIDDMNLATAIDLKFTKGWSEGKISLGRARITIELLSE